MVFFIDGWVIIVNRDDDRLVVTRHDHITRIICVPRVTEEQKLGIGLFLGILLDDLSCEDRVPHIADSTSPQGHLLRGVFRQAKISTVYAVPHTFDMVCPLHQG
jgi:hypothetical protein